MRPSIQGIPSNFCFIFSVTPLILPTTNGSPPLISHTALCQRGPNEHKPSKRNPNKSATMGGPRSRDAAVRTFPPPLVSFSLRPSTAAQPCPFHCAFIMLIELSLQIQKDLICDYLSATLSCVCVCAKVCTCGLTQYLITFFLLFYQRGAIRRLISQKGRALQPLRYQKRQKLEKRQPRPWRRGDSAALSSETLNQSRCVPTFKKGLLRG